jgi:predicted enzyme related to lactoylglutathione lyase
MQVLFAGVAVARFAPAADWYARFFGRPPDVVAHETEVMWRVTDAGWLYVVEDAARSGRGLVAIAVTDLDQALAELAARGIDGGPVTPEGDAGRKSVATDPDGNSVALIQVASA